MKPIPRHPPHFPSKPWTFWAGGQMGKKRNTTKTTHLDLILNQNNDKQNPNQNKQTIDKATAEHM